MPIIDDNGIETLPSAWFGYTGVCWLFVTVGGVWPDGDLRVFAAEEQVFR